MVLARLGRRLSERGYFLLLIIVFAAAVFIRFKNLGSRSLWLDEAWVANAIMQSNLAELVQSAFHAPLFFVLSTRLIISLFANNEFFLRLLPCLFGIGTLFLFYAFIRKQVGKTAALVSLVLLSYSYEAVYYSQELKQYAGAMFFTLLLIYLCERVITHDKTWDWVCFLLVNIIAIGFDHSLLFITITVFTVILLSFHHKHHWLKILVFGSIVSVFTIFFFIFHLRHQLEDSLIYAQKYWIEYYPDTDTWSEFFTWLAQSTSEMTDFFSFPYFPVSLVILLVGLSFFYRQPKKRYFIYIIFPLILALAASFLKRYPYGGSRLMLFVSPLLFISFGKGLDFFISQLRRKKLFVALITLLLFVVVPPVTTLVKLVSEPIRVEEMKPLMEKLKYGIKPSDKLYVYYGAEEAFKYYYKTKHSHLIDKSDIIWGETHRDDVIKYRSDLGKIRQNKRTWLVFSHYRDEEKNYIIDDLRRHGDVRLRIITPGTRAFLFRKKPELN